jgi:branched-subunit amino acid ABC-type transport system permease component
MDLSIAALLVQDGVTNGAIYALLALALVLVFTVTRVIFVPSGEFVAYGTLTLAGLQLGKPPGTIGLLVGMAILAGVLETVASLRGKGVRFETTLPDTAPAALIVAQGKDGPVYRVGFTNFYVLTRYNRSPMYAMAVHDLGEAVVNFMRDATR